MPHTRIKIRLVPNVRYARSALKTVPRAVFITSSQNLGYHSPTSPLRRKAVFTPPTRTLSGGGGVKPALRIDIENRALIAPRPTE